MLINLELVKKLREKGSWSQDQLAAVSGISLRTVQRIEKDGSCALDSKKALAAAFEIDAVDLEINYEAIESAAANQRGTKIAFAAAGIGLIGAYTGITLDVVSGGTPFGEAGVYYGGAGAFFGICCAAIGLRSRKIRQKNNSS